MSGYVLAPSNPTYLASDVLNTGLMQELVAAGLPHVIGMRESILDRAGILFAKAFCAAVARKEVLPVAMQESRIAMTQPLEKAEPWRDASRDGLAELSLDQVDILCRCIIKRHYATTYLPATWLARVLFTFSLFNSNSAIFDSHLSWSSFPFICSLTIGDQIN